MSAPKPSKISRLSGKVAIVTASTSGIGFEIARRFLQEGASVAISSRRESNVKHAVDQLLNDGFTNVLGVVCHVSKKEHRTRLIDETVKRFGGVDILVSNAAVNPTPTGIHECDEQKWDKIFDVNVKSAFFLANETIPHILNRGGGSIIFISSASGYSLGAFIGAYAVSKTALFGLTGMLANYLGRKNIRVNCVAPGLIETKFGAHLINNDKVLADAVKNSALGRIGKPEEMAGIVAFLASDDASFITGETILANGGRRGRL